MASLNEVFPEQDAMMGTASTSWSDFERMTHDGRCIKRQRGFYGLCRCTPAERITLLRNLMNSAQFYRPQFSLQARTLLAQLEEDLKNVKLTQNPHANYNLKAEFMP